MTTTMARNWIRATHHDPLSNMWQAGLVLNLTGRESRDM